MTEQAEELTRGEALARVAVLEAELIELKKRPWPASKDVGRYGDMSQSAHLRVGLDGDNDVYVSIYDDDGGANIEFCVPVSGGGASRHTREALIGLMVALEKDNAADPSRDWWKARGDAPAPVERVEQQGEWEHCQSIADCPQVDAALQAFADDPTGDQGVMIVREVLRAATPERPLQCHECADRVALEAGAKAISDQFLAALRRLTFAARTTGGTAGPDAELMAACEQAEHAISIAGAGRAFTEAVERVEQEAVGTIRTINPCDPNAVFASFQVVDGLGWLPDGTKLYTAPQPAPTAAQGANWCETCRGEGQIDQRAGGEPLSGVVDCPDCRSEAIEPAAQDVAGLVAVPKRALCDFIEYSVHGPYGADDKWLADKKALVAAAHHSGGGN